MAFFKRSLAEDSTDHVIHTWTVALLLVLSLVTFLTSVTLPSDTVTGSETANGVSDLDVICWCPNHFTGSQIVYSHAACKRDIEKAIQDGGNNTNILAIMPDGLDPMSNTGLWKPKYMLHTKVGKTHDSGQNEDEAAKEKEEKCWACVTSDNLHLMLFIFAVVIKVLHILFQVFSKCMTFNVEGTLKAVAHAQTKDPADRRQLMEDIATSTARVVQRSPRRASLTYLSYKFFMFVVMCAFTIFLAGKSGPQEENIEQPLSVSKTKAYDVIFCRVAIEQLQNVQDYSLQCSLSYTQTTSSGVSGVSEETEVVEEWVGYFLVGLFVYFVVSTVFVLITLFAWLFKLVCGKGEEGLKTATALDARFLLLLSHQNISPTASEALAKSGGWRGDGGDVESHVLKPL